MNPEINTNPEIAKQKKILISYLERCGISREDVHAQSVIREIENNNITTFFEEEVFLSEAKPKIITLIKQTSGFFTKPKTLIQQFWPPKPDNKIFVDLVCLGFTFNLFEKEPGDRAVTGIWRGDGVK